jgi:uridine kinase
LEPGTNPANYDFDHPSSLDFEAVFQSLKDLREMKVTKIPVYSFITNAKVPGEFKEIKPKHFVIFEGIMAFYDERIRDLLDLKIFIHCDSDISLCRRVMRDIQDRGRDATEVLTRYNKFVREDYNNFVKPCMKYADIVLPGGANNSSKLKPYLSWF